MQATARFHDLILDMLAPQAEFVFDQPTAFHTANHMLNPRTDSRKAAVVCVLIGGQFTATRFFLAWATVLPATVKP